MNKTKRQLMKSSGIMFILQAAFEHLMSLLVAGSFLATLTKQLGMSDSLTGIISSFISLGCVFQLLSIFMRKNTVKPFVVIWSIINQVLFSLLFIIPLMRVPRQVNIGLFVAAIFLAYFAFNFAHPKKINWMMSLVDDSHRGVFTANKEMISLVSGMIFSFVMGAMVDYFAEIGKIRTAFIISAIVLFVITGLHTAIMVFTVERPLPTTVRKSLCKTISDVFKNKKILGITVIFILYYISTYCTVPFYNTYNINELGFSLKLVTALAIVGSVARILVSRFWGKYADRNSFAVMIEKCLLVLALGYFCMVFATPKNGIVMVAGYNIFHGIALGGVNSALINLVFDYAEPEFRADALAICQAASGVMGFLATLAASPLVNYIQGNNNSIFGISLYAQQVMSIISVLVLIISVIYVRFGLIKKRSK